MILFSWIKDHKKEFLLILILFVVAFFMRFWKIGDYVVFLGDEGRDMLVMKKMIIDKQITFLGPTASVGGFYLGPIYYWMAVPFLAIWRLNPVGPSYMVAIFGLLTVLLLYKFLKEITPSWAAFAASLLYATAPLIVRYSRSSWNPNPLPFFSLLLIYFLYLGIKKQKLIYFLASGICLGFAIQLHYLALLLVGVSALVIFLNTKPKKWLAAAFVSFIGTIFAFSPFLLFEIRHNFPNFRTILEFVTRGTTVGYHSVNFIWLISNGGNILLEEISKLKETSITVLVFWFLTIAGIIGFIKNLQDEKKKLIFSIALIWFLGGLLSLRFYTGQIFDYYFGFMFPAPFVLLGIIFSLSKNKIWIAFSLIFTTVTLVWFLANGFYRTLPNRLINQTERVADFVIEKSQGQPYNFALIATHNSDHAYRYFLEVKNHKPHDLGTLVTDQLIVVCEEKKCAPLGHPLWEIAGFGRAEIVGEWHLENIGIKVFRLTHWPGAPSPAGKPAIKGG